MKRGRPLDVLLVSMPFGPLGRPSLGLTLLKGALRRAGVSVEIRYWTLRGARLWGADFYERVTEFPDMTALLGEWLFGGALPGAARARDDAYLDDVLQLDDKPDALLPGASRAEVRARLRALRAGAPRFVDDCARDVLALAPAVVGLTSTFQQHVASLALATRVKALAPGIATVLGGANCEGVMGIEALRRFPGVDFVVSGEGETIFPELVQRLLAGLEPPARPGLYAGAAVRRGAGAPTVAPPLSNLDDLPVVDYDDYLAQWREADLPADAVDAPTMLFETSRGCWWGERHHCTFCGLNGQSMAFRSKSQPRALAELRHLREKYPDHELAAVDNILDVRYFEEFIPALGTARGADLFYEVKANLRKEQIEALARAGITRVQPGIESLSTPVLRLMRKGVTAIQNVQFLKWCRELGVAPSWNLLYGFPGESPADYRRMSGLLSTIAHLPPPDATGCLRLDRFSPYFEAPERFGLTNVRPAAAYRHVYPLPAEALDNLAYCFDYDYHDARDVDGYTADLDREVVRWQAESPRRLLAMTEKAEDVLIFDGRRVASASVLRLAGLYRRVYLACDRARALPGLVRDVRADAGADTPAERIETVVRDLIERRLVLEDGGHMLSLAVRLGPRYQPPFSLLTRAARRAGAVLAEGGVWRISNVERLIA